MIWSKQTETERIAIRRVLVVVHQELMKIERTSSSAETKGTKLAKAIGITRGAINSLGLGRLEPSEHLELCPCPICTSQDDKTRKKP